VLKTDLLNLPASPLGIKYVGLRYFEVLFNCNTFFGKSDFSSVQIQSTIAGGVGKLKQLQVSKYSVFSAVLL